MSAGVVMAPRGPRRRIRVLDLFAGGGGTSTGLVRGLVRVGLRIEDVDLTAINHDPQALATHRANHPWARHFEDDIEELDPRDILAGEELDILVGSPPCQEYSVAAGGKPKNRQRRATVFYILKWIRYGRPRVGIFENVSEFLRTQEWKRLERGIKALRRVGLGYRVEARVLDAADYGGAQRRRRAFIQIARDEAPIVWPRQTHSDPRKLVAGTRPWRGAIEVLDLDTPTRSVFGRKRPLSPKTRARIARGIRAKGRFWEPLARAVEDNSGPVPFRALLEAAPPGEWPRFLVKFWGTSHTSDPGAPMPSLTAGGQHLALCEVVFTLGQHGEAAARDVVEPLATIATAGYLQVGEARFILPPDGPHGNGAHNPPRDVTAPLAAIRAERGGGHVVEPVLFSSGGPQRTADGRRGVGEPLPTLLTREHLAIAEPILVPHHGEREGQAPRFHDGRAPLQTLPASRAWDVALLRLVTTYNGEGQTRDASHPLGAQTTVERHALVEVRLEKLLVDVGMRMLTVRELARGQGFPESYTFTGNKKQQVAQVGNAVHVDVSEALITSALTGLGLRDTRLEDFDAFTQVST